MIAYDSNLIIGEITLILTFKILNLFCLPICTNYKRSRVAKLVLRDPLNPASDALFNITQVVARLQL